MSGIQIADRFSCPNCEAILKFKRIPKRLVQPCPKCRQLLRLQDRIAAAEPGDNLQSAIEEFVTQAPSSATKQNKIQYEEDPRLDRAEITQDGLLQFDQPWPSGYDLIFLKRIEVTPNPFNVELNMQRRIEMLNGFHRRVELNRTGEVEEIAVVGFWKERKDQSINEGIIGYVPRPIVRKSFNPMPITTAYAARINCAKKVVVDKQPMIQMFVDIAMSTSKKRELRNRTDFR